MDSSKLGRRPIVILQVEHLRPSVDHNSIKSLSNISIYRAVIHTPGAKLLAALTKWSIRPQIPIDGAWSETQGETQALNGYVCLSVNPASLIKVIRASQPSIRGFTRIKQSLGCLATTNHQVSVSGVQWSKI